MLRAFVNDKEILTKVNKAVVKKGLQDAEGGHVITHQQNLKSVVPIYSQSHGSKLDKIIVNTELLTPNF